MRVAFLNNTSIVSGAERSLMELIEALPADIDPLLLAPDGDLLERAAARSVPVASVKGFESSFRLHPVHTSRGMGALASSAIALRRICRRESVDVVHANTARAGLIGSAARLLGAPPLAVMLRDRIPDGRVGDMTRRAIRAGASVVLANSRFVADGYGSAATVVYPPVSLARRPDAGPSGPMSREAAGIPPRAFVVGIVGQITPAKGHETAVRALALLRREVPSATLAVIGAVKFDAPGVRHDNPAYARRLRTLISDLALGEHVRFLGEREDVGAVMRALDVLALPSAAEPFGRVMIEAMLAGTPVVASSTGGPAEVIADGADGLLAEPGEPQAWAAALARLARDPDLRASIAERGRERAADFSPAAHVAAIVSVYRRLAVSEASRR